MMNKYNRLAAEQRAAERRAAEMQRGAEIIARLAIAERFDPDYKPEPAPYHITPAERRRRDEYKKNLPNGRWYGDVI